MAGDTRTVDAARDGHDLVVEFAGDERVLTPGDELTFGRSADLQIDDNRYLHRLIGRFTWSNGMWWLMNTGSSIALRLADASGPSYAKVAPGATVPLAYETAALTFEAGGRPYELRLELLVDTPWFDVDQAGASSTDASTGSTSRRPPRQAHSPSTTSSGCCSSPCASRGSTIRHRTSCRRTGRSPLGSGGRSRSTTASSTGSARSTPVPGCPASAGRATCWHVTVGCASSSTRWTTGW